MIHPGDYLLPELGEELGRYAERKMRRAQSGSDQRGARGELRWLGRHAEQRHVDSRCDAHLDCWSETQPGGRGSAVSERERSDSLQIEYLQVPGFPGLWAAGDCAAVPDGYETRKFFPPTAQHGMREALIAAKNIERTILDQPLKPFRYRTMGMLASIGHHTGVASLFGFKFSGFIAWAMWRSVYLMKLPRLVKKLRVMMAWTLDLLFGRDIEQMITLRDVEELERALGAPSRPARGVAMDATILSGMAGMFGSLCWRFGQRSRRRGLLQRTLSGVEKLARRNQQARNSLRRIHRYECSKYVHWIRSSNTSTNRKGCCRSTRCSTASGFARRRPFS